MNISRDPAGYYTFGVPYTYRRKAELALARREYKEALNYLRSARDNQDPLAWHPIVKLGYKIRHLLQPSDYPIGVSLLEGALIEVEWI